MVQKQWKHSRRAKFGPWSWGRLYRGGNCFLPFLNIPSHPLTAAASLTMCKHPTSASPHVSAGPWGMSRGSHLLSAGVTRSCELAQLVVWDSQHWLMPVPMSAHCMGSEPPAFQLTEQEPTCVVSGPPEGVEWAVWADRCSIKENFSKEDSGQETTLRMLGPFLVWLQAVPNCTTLSGEFCLNLLCSNL